LSVGRLGLCATQCHSWPSAHQLHIAVLKSRQFHCHHVRLVLKIAVLGPDSEHSSGRLLPATED
jgi:hypothetical protein